MTNTNKELLNVLRHYNDGTVCIDAHVDVNNRWQGSYKFFYPDGLLYEEKFYSDNTLEGEEVLFLSYDK